MFINPSYSPLSADDFLAHFEGKVVGIWKSFTHLVMLPTPQSTPTAMLTSFTMLEPTDILQLITNHRATICPLDPIPSAVLQSISGDLLPYLSIINGSLATGIVPPVFKCARVSYFPSYPKLWNELYLTNSLLFSNSTTCLILTSPVSDLGIQWRLLTWQ